jgi:hypothetical protein
MTAITAPPPTGQRVSRQSHVVADAITMLRRSLLHIVRYPGLTMFVIGAPVVFLLLFVFVFGGTLGAGLPGVDPAGGREAYLAFVMPGILVVTIAGTAGGVATTVAKDMTEASRRVSAPWPSRGRRCWPGTCSATPSRRSSALSSCSASVYWSGSARRRGLSRGSPPPA